MKTEEKSQRKSKKIYERKQQQQVSINFSFYSSDFFSNSKRRATRKNDDKGIFISTLLPRRKLGLTLLTKVLLGFLGDSKPKIPKVLFKVHGWLVVTGHFRFQIRKGLRTIQSIIVKALIKISNVILILLLIDSQDSSFILIRLQLVVVELKLIETWNSS